MHTHGYAAYTDLAILFRLLFLVIIALVIDFYTYKGIKTLTFNVKNTTYRKILQRLYLLTLPVLLVYVLVYFFHRGTVCDNLGKGRFLFLVMTLFIILYSPKITFGVFLTMRHILAIIVFFLKSFLSKPVFSDYLSKKIFLKTGIVVSAFVLVLILFGVVIQKNSLHIQREEIYSRNIPINFNGFRIVQISDIHLGSMKSTKLVKKLVKEINALEPDLVVFTGDMVNYNHEEVTAYISIFSEIKATCGKYSILGNHDYGDYSFCYSQTEKDSSVSKLISAENKMGFKVLRNSSNFIVYKDDSILLAGVENWGLPPFKQYGNLKQALSKAISRNFKILLSHDPDHWQQEVEGKTDIDLTLSGHTHAFQMGIYTGIYKWSPAALMYKYWGGLYEEGNQQLYVNRGIGVIGFLGRIGIRPEITLFVLGKEI